MEIHIRLPGLNPLPYGGDAWVSVTDKPVSPDPSSGLGWKLLAEAKLSIRVPAVHTEMLAAQPGGEGFVHHRIEEGRRQAALMAGGGTKKGYVHGKSDATASAPLELPVHPTELLAKIYHAVGIKPDTIVYNHRNQPREPVKGECVRALLG